MGFKRENAERALIQNNNNLERSVDMLVREQDEEDRKKQEEDMNMKNEPKEASKDQIT